MHQQEQQAASSLCLGKLEVYGGCSKWYNDQFLYRLPIESIISAAELQFPSLNVHDLQLQHTVLFH